MYAALHPLVLASGSPRRRELLGGLGLDFQVVPADVPENPLPDEGAGAFARRVARDKALAVSAAHPEAFTLGADTVVALEKRKLGKPSDRDEAVRFLLALAGREHEVLTAFCVARGGEPVAEQVETTVVTFRSLDEAAARAYAATGEPDDKAGAYAIQGVGAYLVREIRGSYTNVVGLPVAELVDALLDLEAIVLVEPDA